MSLNRRQNVPEMLNGNEIIKIVNAGSNGFLRNDTFQGMITRNDMMFREKHSEYHLGLLEAWGMQTTESTSMIGKILDRGSELLVNGFFGSFTYEKPFYEPRRSLRTVVSTMDMEGDYPGIDSSVFEIVLSEKCYEGEILGTDLYDSGTQQLRVIDTSVLEGTAWRTKVQLTSLNASDYYNKALLDKDINYYRIDHTVVEFSDRFKGVRGLDSEPAGHVTARFKLGGVRGVEGTVTGFADVMTEAKANGVPMAGYDQSLEKNIRAYQNKYAQGDSEATAVIFGKSVVASDGRKQPALETLRASSLMEFLVEKELMLTTDMSHMWLKSGIARNVNGANAYLNEGVYHQMKRGKVISFPKYMGITRAHIEEAVRYLYKNNPDLPWQERKIVFEVGSLAEKNLLRLFNDEIKLELSTLMSNQVFTTLLGDRGLLSDSLRQSFVTGSSIDDLHFSNLIKFTSVTLVGIGQVSFKLNTALNRLHSNSSNGIGGFENGWDWTAHSMFIWDVTDSEFSNNLRGITGVTHVDGNANVKITDNLYLVRPKQGMTYKGSSNGRWDRGKTEGIISSNSYIGQEFWAFNCSAKWVPYPERCVIIEMAPGARRRGSTPYGM